MHVRLLTSEFWQSIENATEATEVSDGAQGRDDGDRVWNYRDQRKVVVIVVVRCTKVFDGSTIGPGRRAVAMCEAHERASRCVEEMIGQ